MASPMGMPRPARAKRDRETVWIRFGPRSLPWPSARSAVPPTWSRVRFEGSDEDDCVARVDAEHVPACDPTAGHVVALQTYAQAMSTRREAALVWIDATSGEVVRTEDLLADTGGLACRRADRKARRRAKVLNEELREGAWEAMTALEIRRVHPDAYDNVRAELDDAEGEDLELAKAWAQELMPKGQVHVAPRTQGTVIRLPGVRVYERNVPIDVATLSELVGHRRSGVVAVTHATCRVEEDCTCNLQNRTTVLRWSLETLAAIDAHPCALLDADRGDAFACVLRTIFG